MSDYESISKRATPMDGHYYADEREIWKAPVAIKKEGGGQSISIGFPVCTVSECVKPEDVVASLNASAHPSARYDALKASHDELVQALARIATDLREQEETKMCSRTRLEQILDIDAALARARALG